MNFSEYIQKNPMMAMDMAYDLLAYLSILQHGISYPETITDAIIRVGGHAEKLVKTKKDIPRRYMKRVEISPELAAECPEARYVEVLSHELHTIGYDMEQSTVNFVKLLEYFNEGLASNGLSPLRLQLGQVRNEELASISTTPETIHDLAKAVAYIVRTIVDREEKVRTETLNSVCDEAFQKIIDKSVYDLLPEIKKNIKIIVKDQVTSGRPKTLTDKKMRASISLAEQFSSKGSNPLLRKDILEYLTRYHGGEFSKADREHVANVYLESLK